MTGNRVCRQTPMSTNIASKRKKPTVKVFGGKVHGYTLYICTFRFSLKMAK